MKKRMVKLLSCLLIACMVLPFAACGNQGQENQPAASVDAGALYEYLQTAVKFDTELADMSASAEISYAGLPEGAKVTMYAGNARYADELTWVALQNEADLEAASKVVEGHLADMRKHFVSYQQDQVSKFDSAKIWKDSKNIILCITADEAVRTILDNPGQYVQAPSSEVTDGTTQGDGTEPAVPETDTPVTDAPTDPPTEPVTKPPAVTAPNTGISYYDAYLVVNDMAYEYYNYSDSAAASYAKLVSRVANALQGETTVYSMVIPTAIGVVFPDNVDYSREDQAQRLQEIYGKMDSTVVPVNIFDKLLAHRNEYLYYRTDWHWTGTGAYYGYERFCEVKGVAPYTMDQREEHIYTGYKGPFSAVSTPDDIYAYEPYYKEQVRMDVTQADGAKLEDWPVINSGSAYWAVFAAGDQPFAQFTNSAVTDGSVAIVVKESFGNAIMSYICDHYSTVYEIDYRYWKGDLVDFAREVGADDIIFANNIGMVRSSYLIGLMANIIP